MSGVFSHAGYPGTINPFRPNGSNSIRIFYVLSGRRTHDRKIANIYVLYVPAQDYVTLLSLFYQYFTFILYFTVYAQTKYTREQFDRMYTYGVHFKFFVCFFFNAAG